MRVWAARSLIVKNLRQSLHSTLAEAEAYIGTANRHRYEYICVDLDVVFMLIRSGRLDEGGGTVLGVYATREAAAAHIKRSREDEVEIWEVETS